MVLNMFNRFKYIWILLAVLLFHTYMSYAILNKSEICRKDDDAARIIESLNYYRFIFLGSHRPLEMLKHISQLRAQAHPPFYITIQALISKLLLRMFDRFDENSILLTTNTLFLFILLVSVYGIGSTLYDRNTGILSAFLVSFFPMVFGHSRNFLIDFPLAAMTALSFYLLFKTNKFQSRSYSILLGITLGLSQLTKEAFVGYIFFPFIYYFCNSCRTIQKRKVSLNAILTLLFAAIIIGGVYLKASNFFAFRTYIGKVFLSNPEWIEPPLYYFKNILSFTGTFLAIAIVPLLIDYFRGLKSQNKTVLLWFFAPLVIFSFSPNKDHRFILPILPALALMVIPVLLKSRTFLKIKLVYAGFLIFVSVFQYFIYFFDLRSFDPHFYRQYFDANFPGILTYQKDKYYRLVSEMLEFFKQEKADFNKVYDILFLFNIGKISNTLQYKLQLEGLPFYIQCPQEAHETDAPASGTVNWHSLVLSSDYIVEKSGYKTESTGSRKIIEEELREGFRRHRADFKKIAEIEVFDGSYLYIYKNLHLG